jgi:hypothetical protein
MNLKLCLLLSTLVILLPKYGQSQVDTLDVLSLFPLHVGDQWQYLVKDYLNPFDTTYSMMSVSKDTTMPNGKKYYEIIRNASRFGGYLRVDSSNYIVYQYDGWNNCTNDSESVLYNLDLNNDSIIYCPPISFHGAFYGTEQVGLLPYYRMQYRYDFADGVSQITNILASGFGIAYKNAYAGISAISQNLIAAKINNVTYGQFITSIREEEIIIKKPTLYQNYPNPFNLNTHISFYLQKPDHVVLEVYNTVGQRVAILINENINAGDHSLPFDGSSLGSGVYLYILKTKTYTDVKKMLLLK